MAEVKGQGYCNIKSANIESTPRTTESVSILRYYYDKVQISPFEHMLFFAKIGTWDKFHVSSPSLKTITRYIS